MQRAVESVCFVVCIVRGLVGWQPALGRVRRRPPRLPPLGSAASESSRNDLCQKIRHAHHCLTFLLPPSLARLAERQTRRVPSRRRVAMASTSDSMTSLPLPTPDSFSFPYALPYEIQRTLMKVRLSHVEGVVLC